jgi:dipeptidyl aminopeptidase/acylaminoacyl peptidase
VDGSRTELLIGAGKGERLAAFLIDDLPNDDKNVLVAVSPFDAEPMTRVELLDVYNGRRKQVARAPIRRANFTSDNDGIVRFALGAGSDNINKLYYRDGEGKEWKLINDEAVSDRIEIPVGFSADNQIAYLQVEQTQGPDAIIAMDVAAGTRKEVLRDDDTDPSRIIYRAGTSIPVGAMFIDGKPRTEFFDSTAPEARLYKSLEAAFAPESPYITSTSKDGRLALVQTYSDRNPGDFYVFDTVAKKADHVISRRTWFDPGKMAEMRPVALTARDGLPLKGYLTVPHGSTGKNLPLVVLPHGGPFGVSDEWGFDGDNQMLASAGYAVLQLNFRGSGKHGRAFEEAGRKQWGGTMQDDLTDATRWAIQQGIADPNRICIYGASYGGYASLMGVAKEPSLYKCAVGYVGVYDLPMMHTRGDIQERRSGENFVRDWIGEKDKIAGASPNRIAGQIKVPVFLAAGGEDQRAPIEHSEMMERALIGAGVPVETLYYDTEGHGFYTDEHRREYYTRLLNFFARHIGGAPAKPAASTSK